MPYSAEAQRDPGQGRLAWLALAAVLGAGAGLAFGHATGGLDWQPAMAWREPWRAWTAAWVHFSALHLAANLAGVGLVAALGVAAHVPTRSAVAWLVAWPLTQLALVVRADLLHYGGLSGVLHAGVAVVALHLIVAGSGTRRRIGLAVLAVLVVKVASESPWADLVRHPAGWDIGVAPFAHLTGLLAGLAMAALGEAVQRQPLTIVRHD